MRSKPLAASHFHRERIPLADAALALAPGTGYILYTRYQAAGDDLVIFERTPSLR